MMTFRLEIVSSYNVLCGDVTDSQAFPTPSTIACVHGGLLISCCRFLRNLIPSAKKSLSIAFAQ